MQTHLTAIVLAAAAAPALAGPTETFFIPIPEIGTELFFNNGGIPNSNLFNGGTVIDARLELVLTVTDADPGSGLTSSAANFRSELIIPVDIEPQPGVQAGVVLINGDDEGWSGTGEFTISRQIDSLIGGTWTSPLFYTASTYLGSSATDVVIGTTNGFFTSFVTVTVEQVPSPGAAGVLAMGGLMAARRRC